MTTMLLFLAISGWLAIGLGLSLVLGRRGHDPFTWFVLGTLLGPFAVALAVAAWRGGEEARPEDILTPRRPPREGVVDVLVGFDDSPESRAALASVISLLGPRLGRLELVTVIPFDGGLINERQARAALERGAAQVAPLEAGLQVVRGEPAAALVAATTEGGFDLLAVGTTGGGRAHVFGSAARQLAGRSKVPVLLTGAGPEPAQH